MGMPFSLHTLPQPHIPPPPTPIIRGVVSPHSHTTAPTIHHRALSLVRHHIIRNSPAFCVRTTVTLAPSSPLDASFFFELPHTPFDLVPVSLVASEHPIDFPFSHWPLQERLMDFPAQYRKLIEVVYVLLVVAARRAADATGTRRRGDRMTGCALVLHAPAAQFIRDRQLRLQSCLDVTPLCHAGAQHFSNAMNSAAPQSRPWSAPYRYCSFRLPASWPVLCRLNKLHQILASDMPGFLNPLLSTTAFFICCGMRRQFSICADVTPRRFDIPHREWTMWHVEHSSGKFRLCRNRVAVAAQSQSSMAEGLPTRHVTRDD